MPILKPGAVTRVTPPPTNFIDRIRAGRVVPVISDEACFELALQGYEPFLAEYAALVNYPLADKENLVKMAKFYQLQGVRDQAGEPHVLSDEDLKAHYLLCVKSYIYRLAKREGIGAEQLAEAEAQIDDVTASTFSALLGYPRLVDGQADLLLVLANLPIKLYLTTSPYTFIEEALKRAGKVPRTELCRWHRALDTIDSVIDDAYRPSPNEPLVYHLHGLDRHADSLVLTEDDYLEFLVNVAQGQGNNAIDRVHALVRKALADDLIVLGFHLNSWAFRVLYAGLINPSSKAEDRGICCLQLVPNAEEKRYLEDYIRREAKFDLFWGTLAAYAQELPRF
jgi:hypothetical protein